MSFDELVGIIVYERFNVQQIQENLNLKGEKMYSVLISKIVSGMEVINDDSKKLVNESDKVVILPWAFPTEINSDKLIN